MTDSERRSRNAVQEAMDRRDNGGPTGHQPSAAETPAPLRRLDS